MLIKFLLPFAVGMSVWGQLTLGLEPREFKEEKADNEDLGKQFMVHNTPARKRRGTDSDQAQLPSPYHPPSNEPTYYPGNCWSCPPGPPGPMGPSGRDGRDGRDQLIVTSREPDCPGTAAPSTSPGKTYIHWGRSSCPEGSSLVYEGITSGKDYTKTGSGTNYLCLHNQPTYDNPIAGRLGWIGRIYGTEFEMSFPGIPNLSIESEIPCAVCLATAKNDVLMIPGRNTCPDQQDWHEEYHGYLAAQHVNYQATEFICLDKESEGIPRTGHDNDPSLLYLVESGCNTHGGGLPCPPYVDGYEVTCAVCSL